MKSMKYSVSGITAEIKALMEGSFSTVEVEGEISNCKFSSTGHMYFSLKDNTAKLQCALFRSSLSRVPFMPEDGQMVIAKGTISVYPPSGNYQLICRSLTHAGEGQILKVIEERKKKYASLGFFDADRKKNIPQFPKQIVVITSPNGAAIRDILNVVNRRNAGINVRILPAPVQGTNAAVIIANQIHIANRYNLGEVIIIGRGGGALEDLLPFSEECVIDAVAESRIPVISAVGHEIDFALSDFAADVRAATPSAAAELVTGELSGLIEYINRTKRVLIDTMTNNIKMKKLYLNNFRTRDLSIQLRSYLSEMSFYIQDIKSEISKCFRSTVSELKQSIQLVKTELIAKSPTEVLSRGYVLVSLKENGYPVKSVDGLSTDDSVKLHFHDGKAEANIISIPEKKGANK